MSNKTQLQTNNTKYASLIETLRGKAVSSGTEDLDAELTEQESLISELSNILDSKVSGGSGGDIETCIVTFNPSSVNINIYYYDITTATGGHDSFSSLEQITITTQKNSIIVLDSVNCSFDSLSYSKQGDVEVYRISGNILALCARGDGSISIDQNTGGYE